MASGTQPPCRILSAFEPRNAASMMSSTAVSDPAVHRLQPHTCRATTYASTVVIVIVAVIAMP